MIPASPLRVDGAAAMRELQGRRWRTRESTSRNTAGGVEQRRRASRIGKNPLTSPYHARTGGVRQPRKGQQTRQWGQPGLKNWSYNLPGEHRGDC